MLYLFAGTVIGIGVMQLTLVVSKHWSQGIFDLTFMSGGGLGVSIASLILSMLSYGWANRLLVSPQVHRIHHSIRPEHRDKNFVIAFPVWDIIFGTYHHPFADAFADGRRRRAKRDFGAGGGLVAVSTRPEVRMSRPNAPIDRGKPNQLAKICACFLGFVGCRVGRASNSRGGTSQLGDHHGQGCRPRARLAHARELRREHQGSGRGTHDTDGGRRVSRAKQEDCRFDTPLIRKPIRYLIDTHWHWDHVGANADFAALGATIVSSVETRELIIEAQRRYRAHELEYAPNPDAIPSLTVDSAIEIHFPGESVQIVHVPAAHTSGDLVVRFQNADVLQTGDTFFQGFYPDIDIDHGGTIEG